MEQKSANLDGMNAAEAKEYILGFIATLKLTEKEILSCEEDAAKWEGRAALARSKGMEELAREAEGEAEKVDARLAALRGEALSLGEDIAAMRRQLPALAARERSVDPDLLEQELLMAAGYLPGEEEKAQSARRFGKLEKEAAAERALEELKTKMNG